MKAREEFQLPIVGRGTASNLENRFTKFKTELYFEASHAQRPETYFQKDASRSVIVYNDSPDVGFDASVNAYRGCERGCDNKLPQGWD